MHSEMALPTHRLLMADKNSVCKYLKLNKYKDDIIFYTIQIIAPTSIYFKKGILNTEQMQKLTLFLGYFSGIHFRPHPLFK